MHKKETNYQSLHRIYKSIIKYCNSTPETDVIKMFEFLIDNIFFMLGVFDLQHTVGIPIDRNCTPLLAEIFPYSYEAEFISELRKKNQRKLARSVILLSAM